MSDWGWILAGGAALTGFLSVSWNYIKSLWNQLAGRVIVTADLRGSLAEALGCTSGRTSMPRDLVFAPM